MGKPDKETPLSEAPELSPAQKASMLRIKQRMTEKNRLKLKAGEDGKLEAVETLPGMAAIQILEATGSTDYDAANLLANQVVNAQSSPQKPESANAVIALLHGIEPQDELEGMLATQMVAVHNLSMEYARRAMGKDIKMENADRYINRASKLMNIFTRQIETLQRYRTKGQQKIVVQHVQVSEGGQAIIGDVHQGGAGG